MDKVISVFKDILPDQVVNSFGGNDITMVCIIVLYVVALIGFAWSN